MSATATPIRECDQALDYLYSMLEGEAKTRFEAHLATCPRCQAELEGFGKVRTAAQAALVPVEPSERLTGPLHAQLMHAAAQRKGRGKVIPFLRRVANHPGYAVAATLVLVVGVAGVQFSRGKLFMSAKDRAPATSSVPAPETVAAAPAGEPAPQQAEPAATPTTTEDKVLPAKELLNKPLEQPVKLAEPKAAEKAKAVGSKDDALAGLASRRSVARDQHEFDDRRVITARLKKESGRITDGLDSLDGALRGGGGAQAKSYAYGQAEARPSPPPPPTSQHAASSRAAAPQAVAPPASVAAPPAPVATSVPAEKKRAANAPADDAIGDIKQPEAQRGRGYQARNDAPAAALPAGPPRSGNDEAAAAGEGERSAAMRAEPQADSTEEARPRKPASDDVDADRGRAASLAQAGRCEEATAIYARLDQKSPARLSAHDRLSYTRCLRTLGRLEPAQDELNQLRAHRAQNRLPISTLDAEQNALDVQRKREVSNVQRRAAKGKKGNVDTDATVAPPAEPSKADTRRVY
jgi:hypothetical protein